LLTAGAGLLKLLDLALAAALLAVPAAWLLDPLRITPGPLNLSMHWGIKPVLLPVILFAARTLAARGLARLAARCGRAAPRGFWESALFKKISASVISASVFFILLEAALVQAGFEAALPPVIIQGEDGQGGVRIARTVPDPHLLYRFEPGSTFAGRRINSLGFRDREVSAEKPAGVRRVICMGDSVTAQGLPGYSQYLHDRLTNDPPTPETWEAFNLGVHGYTALQGLRLFQRTGRSLQADIVTVFYGWNDHWLTETPDRQLMGLEMRPLAGRIMGVLQRKRSFGLVVWAMAPIHQVATRPAAGRVPRVAPDEYYATLKAFVREIRAAGAVPLLITAPRRALSAEIVAKEYAPSVDAGQRIHDAYADLTRRAARDSGADLLDLAKIFGASDCDSLFAADGVHFDHYALEGRHPNPPAEQPGLSRIGEELDRAIRAQVSSPDWPSR